MGALELLSRRSRGQPDGPAEHGSGGERDPEPPGTGGGLQRAHVNTQLGGELTQRKQLRLSHTLGDNPSRAMKDGDWD